MKKRIYVSHPYGGEINNQFKVTDLISEFVDKDINKEYIFYSPIHCFNHLYNKLDYVSGINYCLDMLSQCDEIWLCGDWESSKGCLCEYGYSLAKGIKMVIVADKKEDEELKPTKFIIGHGAIVSTK